MAVLPQGRLFSWKEIENIGDLARLKLVLEALPDEALMRALETHRGKGRDDYPIRAVWNSILAGIVFEHKSVESLRRELLRNDRLRWLCGFDPLKPAEQAVPGSYVYSRLLTLLLKQTKQIDEMFDALVTALQQVLPDFGLQLAMDGKAIETHAKSRDGLGEMKPDGRRDVDADFGKKTYKGVRDDGTPWKKVVSWFGYKLHLLVDAQYELPVGYLVTKASANEIPQAKVLLEKVNQRHPKLLEATENYLGDRGLDDGELIRKLWDDHGIKPVIDIRNCWKDGEETKLVQGQSNVVYNYKGQVYCYCPRTGEQRKMAYGGFEQDRQTLKYRCPAIHYGLQCAGCNVCPVGKAIRISLNEDRRVFTPIARDSYKWDSLYKKRTAVERVNSRLDVSFGFENHFIRGLEKMQLRVGLALVVMLAMALGRIKHKQKENLRSLVKAVA